MDKIAILDFNNHDVGLKILFPEADYFILEKDIDRPHIYSKYGIKIIEHGKDLDVFEHICNNKYDYLFIIAPLYNSLITYNGNKNPSYSEIRRGYLLNTFELLKTTPFKQICFFDNYDYDYDPNIIFEEEFTILKQKNILFFKRYMNKEKQYAVNVVPFPYIIFGKHCNIDMVNDIYYKNTPVNKQARIFFSGSPLVHVDETYGLVRNRRDIMIRIMSKIGIYNPGHVSHEIFMNEMRTSKYSLDLLGVGDPNIRTFEILASGSLRLGERSNLKWNFEDEFCEETIFDNENDLLEKLIRLENEPGLYERCLQKQNEIVERHMNINTLKTFILSKITPLVVSPKKYNLAFYCYFYGSDKNTNGFLIPEIPSTIYDCYYYTNNRSIFEKLQNTKWIAIFDDKSTTDDLIESNMVGKHIKSSPHLYEKLKDYDYLCYLDSKLEKVSESFVENYIDKYFIQKNYALLLREHWGIHHYVWLEFGASMAQERYRLESDRYIDYILKKIKEGFSHATHNHCATGFLIRNMKHPLMNNINNTWYEHIQECGIQCQIAFFFVKQLFDGMIHSFTESPFTK